jgi:hypothetical protein
MISRSDSSCHSVPSKTPPAIGIIFTTLAFVDKYLPIERASETIARYWNNKTSSGIKDGNKTI